MALRITKSLFFMESLVAMNEQKQVVERGPYPEARYIWLEEKRRCFCANPFQFGDSMHINVIFLLILVSILTKLS